MKNSDQKQRIRKVRSAADRIGNAALALVLLLNAVCMLIWMETVWRNSYSNMMVFLVERTRFAVFGASFILCVSLLPVLLLGRAAPALAISNLFFLLLGIVQYFKLEMRGEPFFFTDLTMAEEAMGVVGNMTNGGIEFTSYMMLAFVLMVVILPLMLLGVRVWKGKLFRRFSCAMLLLIATGGCMMFATTDLMGVEEGFNMTRQDDDYARRGMIVAFVNRIPLPGTEAIEEPEDYGPQTVQTVLAGHKGMGEEPSVKPNILFVMSESYYDVTQDFKLSEDPLAYFRELQEMYWGGSYVTPVYGGSTAVAEYEVLTGYRVDDTKGLCFTAPGGVMQEGMLSLPSLLKSYGYYTQAIHPGTRTFYSRESAYAKLGFDSSLFRDDLDPVPKEEFPYPSDEYLFEQIIKAYESRPKDQPWFCHAVTYQNHGGYGFESSMNAVSVEEELDDVSMLNARNYVNMLKLSDDALRDLIAYFDAQEEPTVIVVWGDHAPAIRQFGKNLPESPMDMLSYYQTPLMIYNNYGLEVSGLPQNISSYRLGAYVLRLLGMDRDPYFNYLSSDEAENIWVFGGLVEKDGAWTADQELNDRAAETMRMLHYDRLYGERYGEGL